MTKQEEILRVARSCVGIPWRHGGRTRSSVDCVGLPVLVATEMGMKVLDAPPGYSRRPDGTLLKYLRENMEEIPLSEIFIPSDLEVYWLRKVGKSPQHVGIRTECGGLIHSDSAMRKVVEITDISFWKMRTCARFRWR